MRFMSTEGALELMRLAGEVHAGNRRLPPEIVAKKWEIAAAKRKAELFVLHFRVVDEWMVRQVVNLMHELDALYAAWGENNARTAV